MYMYTCYDATPMPPENRLGAHMHIQVHVYYMYVYKHNMYMSIHVHVCIKHVQ